jgi:hypothetical protein
MSQMVGVNECNLTLKTDRGFKSQKISSLIIGVTDVLFGVATRLYLIIKNDE